MHDFDGHLGQNQPTEIASSCDNCAALAQLSQGNRSLPMIVGQTFSRWIYFGRLQKFLLFIQFS